MNKPGAQVSTVVHTTEDISIDGSNALSVGIRNEMYCFDCVLFFHSLMLVRAARRMRSRSRRFTAFRCRSSVIAIASVSKGFTSRQALDLKIRKTS